MPNFKVYKEPSASKRKLRELDRITLEKGERFIVSKESSESVSNDLLIDPVNYNVKNVDSLSTFIINNSKSHTVPGWLNATFIRNQLTEAQQNPSRYLKTGFVYYDLSKRPDNGFSISLLEGSTVARCVLNYQFKTASVNNYFFDEHYDTTVNSQYTLNLSSFSNAYSTGKRIKDGAEQTISGQPLSLTSATDLILVPKDSVQTAIVATELFLTDLQFISERKIAYYPKEESIISCTFSANETEYIPNRLFSYNNKVEISRLRNAANYNVINNETTAVFWPFILTISSGESSYLYCFDTSGHAAIYDTSVYKIELVNARYIELAGDSFPTITGDQFSYGNWLTAAGSSTLEARTHFTTSNQSISFWGFANILDGTEIEEYAIYIWDLLFTVSNTEVDDVIKNHLHV